MSMPGTPTSLPLGNTPNSSRAPVALGSTMTGPQTTSPGGKGGAVPTPTSGVASTMYANPQQQAQQPSIYTQSATNLQNAQNTTNNAAALYGNIANNGGNVVNHMGQYMNPYTNQVINRAANDMNRQTQMQLNNVGAEAAMSGAFGGSRHGLVEATTHADAQRQIGDMSAQMRNQGWNNAASLAQQDADRRLAAAGGWLGAGGQQAGLAGQQFDMGNTLGDRQFQQGEFARQLQQQVMTGANNQFMNTTMQPQQLLSTLLQSIGMSPLNNATKTTGTTTPGLFDYLSLGSQMLGGRMM